ncbi:MAG TPA: tryptophan 2,3-dioxygenase family protein [Bacteroidia bacterium]|jgi:tryptophan 2,3-dioxygenase|nr:tryptophan 2,3-dioxygenase family protein [Bacteroidia bacterium]
MEITPDIAKRLDQLNEKYQAMGQDMKSYLEGLQYMDYLKYWDYVHTDTLLSLQNPRTNFPDEKIFILYHQITELFFKLCLHEYEQIAEKKDITVDYLIQKLKRIVHYFDGLNTTYGIMIDGMEKDQFLKFRMALLPASGFQSAQYRMIELYSTDLVNLMQRDYITKNPETGNLTIKEKFQHIYWKAGATELATGRKTLTLIQFEEKYSEQFLILAEKCIKGNVYARYHELSEADKKNPELIQLMRDLDSNISVNWRLQHYKSAVKYLQGDPEIIAATGGTNWQKFLPPRFQRIIFYPELWSDDEKANWGKAWVEHTLKG